MSGKLKCNIIFKVAYNHTRQNWVFTKLRISFFLIDMIVIYTIILLNNRIIEGRGWKSRIPRLRGYIELCLFFVNPNGCLLSIHLNLKDSSN